MKKKNSFKINQIVKYDSPALTAIIDYWEDYETNTVLLAYAELKKRKYIIPNRILNRQIEFCTNNGFNNMEEYLNSFFKEEGKIVFDEYFNKIASEENKLVNTGILTENLNSKINVEKIIQAGKAIKGIFTAVLALIICLFIGVLVVLNSTDLDTIKSIYIFMGIMSLLLNLAVLYNLAAAGDNLENVTSFQEDEA